MNIKKHLINIWFETSVGNFNYVGYVTTRVIDPGKLFFKAFGFEVPDKTEITLI